MTFLELCKRVRMESGISGEITSVTGQQGIYAKLVMWVKQADLDIQRMHPDWTFMWRSVVHNLQVGVRDYLPGDLGIQLVRESLSFQLGKDYLQIVDWGRWMKEFNLRLVDSPAQPSVVTQRPDGHFVFDRIPDQEYSLTITYITKPTAMTGNDSTSVIPSEYHEAIVHRALYLYAKQEEDQYLMQSASLEFENITSQMAAEYLPDSDFDRGVII